MHALHGNCTGSCASESQYTRGLQPFAHITHIFYKRIYRNHSEYDYGCNPLAIRSRESKLRFWCAMCAIPRIASPYWFSAAQLCVCIDVHAVQKHLCKEIS
jgi:hypothetical protein